MAIDVMAMLNDTQTYADTLEITAPNGEKAPLGEVRKAWAAREIDLARKAGEVEARGKSVREAQIELANVYSALTSEREALAAREGALRAKPAPVASFDDDFIAASKTRIEALEALVNNQNANLEIVRKNQFQMADAYLNKSWELDTARLSKDAPEGVTIDRNTLLKVANDEGYKDKYGMPDLGKAYEKVVAPVKAQADIKAAEDRGYARAKEEDMMRSLSPTPFRTVATGLTTKAGKADFTSLDDAFAAAANDPLTARLLSGNIDLGN